MDKIEEIVPDQESGGKTDIEESVNLNSEQEAKDFFNIVRERVKNVNRWHELAGKASADFHLTDATGNKVNRFVETGDYLQISIPAPGTKAGEGYDWVRIENIEDKPNETGDEEAFGMTVRPASNPKDQSQDTAHFFKDAATSSFLVQRKGKAVSGAVRGRNEKPNTKADSIVDKARNALVGAGAIAGLSDAQWKRLVRGWLDAK